MTSLTSQEIVYDTIHANPGITSLDVVKRVTLSEGRVYGAMLLLSKEGVILRYEKGWATRDWLSSQPSPFVSKKWEIVGHERVYPDGRREKIEPREIETLWKD